MTVKEAAAAYGLTRQTVYARLKGRVDHVTDKSGQLTAPALEVLKELYGDPDNVTVKNSHVTDKDSNRQTETDKVVKGLTDQLKAAQDEAASLRQACEVLQVKLDTTTDRVKELSNERDYLRVMLDRSMLLALPAPDQGGDKLTIWERITGRRSPRTATAPAQTQSDKPTQGQK